MAPAHPQQAAAPAHPERAVTYKAAVYGEVKDESVHALLHTVVAQTAVLVVLVVTVVMDLSRINFSVSNRDGGMTLIGQQSPKFVLVMVYVL